MPSTNNSGVRTLREQWHNLKTAVLQWENCANAFLGDALKNPAARKRHGTRTYRENNTVTHTQ